MQEAVTPPLELVAPDLDRKLTDHPGRRHLGSQPFATQRRQFGEIVQRGENEPCRGIHEYIEEMVVQRHVLIGFIDHGGLLSHAIAAQHLLPIRELIRVFHQKT
jgi:hypothetical protein